MAATHLDAELSLLRGPWRKAAAAVLLALFLYVPHGYPDRTLGVLVLVAAYALGAIGLNLLTGFTGQVSLGHATFFAVGAYCTAALGHQRQWPFPAYLAAAVLLGLLLGAVVGPFALRLRGNYLAVVTIGLLFVSEYVLRNWESLTRPVRGTAPTRDAPIALGPLDFGRGLDLGSAPYTRQQSLFWLSWAMVALAALAARNIVRSRPGRAMQAVRDRDLAAEVMGVDPARTKVGAFAVAGALAAAGGVVYAWTIGALDHQELSGQRGLLVSITFVAVIIVGGMGTVHGSILGALVVVYGQRFIADNGPDAPLLGIPVERGWLTTGELTGILFGVLILVFLVVEPRGMAALWMRARARLVGRALSNRP
ncbi:MAG: branched-chain amino acid ABC transporter permease, partial [Acidimicrobiia bacterium]